MNRKNVAVALTIIGIVVIAGTSVTASISAMHAPLYILRMEQASNSMNFLPRAVNGFTYTAEKGYELNLGIGESCNINGYCGNLSPYSTGDDTCWTCDTCVTQCEQNTCLATCATCATCPATCPATCEGATCSGATCSSTCLPKRTCFVTSCIEC
ncbi:MAG: hypothetical protein WBA22_10225 [Candidatus Methanofastidiosia archaeon]